MGFALCAFILMACTGDSRASAPGESTSAAGSASAPASAVVAAATASGASLHGSPTPRSAAENEARRGRNLADAAFWNRPATIAELGLRPEERRRMDELLIAFVDPLRERNRAHRAAGEAWIAALASRDEAGARHAIEQMQALAVEGARESLRLKRDLLEVLRPETRARLAERYPRLLATNWVRGNRLVDTTDLSKWSGRPHPESAAGEGDSANP